MKLSTTILILLLSILFVSAQDTVKVNNTKRLNSIYIQNQSALIAIDYERQFSFNLHTGMFLKGGVGVLPFMLDEQMLLIPLVEGNLYYAFNKRHFIEGGVGIAFIQLDPENIPYVNFEYRLCSRKGFLFKAGLQYYKYIGLIPSLGIGCSF